jgi:signal peptidase II
MPEAGDPVENGEAGAAPGSRRDASAASRVPGVADASATSVSAAMSATSGADGAEPVRPVDLAGASNPAWLRWLGLSAAVIVVDQITKWAILARFRPGERLPVIRDLFDLVLAFNPGAAFSFLSTASGWQRYAFAGLAVVISAGLVWFLRRPGSALLHLGLALILGGAIGNLIDRLWIGEVVDFLLVYYRSWSWPAFNVADSAITIGAALLILDSFRQRHREPAGVN